MQRSCLKNDDYEIVSKNEWWSRDGPHIHNQLSGGAFFDEPRLLLLDYSLVGEYIASSALLQLFEETSCEILLTMILVDRGKKN